jgi:very-short-patch-repair endonuclease
MEHDFDLDVAIQRIAATQRGLITRAQLAACGASDFQVRRRVAVGALAAVGPGVSRVAAAQVTWEQSLLAALLCLGCDAWVSHRAAAALYGFDGFPKRPLDVTVLRSGRGLLTPAALHTTTRLDQIDRFNVSGFACTSASRTVIDLARICTLDELERAIDSAIRDGWTSTGFLAKRLADLRGSGRAGVRLLDEVLLDSGGHSWLERRFLRLVRLVGLPRPRCQMVFARDSVTVARVDFLFDPHPVVVEVTGRLGHTTDLDRRRDAQRRNELQSIGKIVLEFTRDDVVRRPDYVERILRHHVSPPFMSTRRATR